MTAFAKLEVGSTFARDFRVVRPLASGGMGAVYVVEQLSTGHARALKVMHPALAPDAKSRERFEQEARVSARIASDHVVQVVAAGIDAATAMPWLAMELLEGEELAQVVERRGALPVEEVREIVRQLGHALAAAHRAGLVHRDLKPENVFLAAPRHLGMAFTVKLLDFGIAKVLQENHTAGTATGVVGSPLWMAPEQLEHAGKIRPATDVWALGLVAFYLLTGRTYWHAANRDDAAVATVLCEIMMGPLEPASVRAAGLGVALPAPPAFDAWFARCVVRAADQRFRDAGEAVADLERALTAPPARADHAARDRGAMAFAPTAAHGLAVTPGPATVAAVYTPSPWLAPAGLPTPVAAVAQPPTGLPATAPTVLPPAAEPSLWRAAVLAATASALFVGLGAAALRSKSRHRRTGHPVAGITADAGGYVAPQPAPGAAVGLVPQAVPQAVPQIIPTPVPSVPLPSVPLPPVPLPGPVPVPGATAAADGSTAVVRAPLPPARELPRESPPAASSAPSCTQWEGIQTAGNAPGSTVHGTLCVDPSRRVRAQFQWNTPQAGWVVFAFVGTADDDGRGYSLRVTRIVEAHPANGGTFCGDAVARFAVRDRAHMSVAYASTACSDVGRVELTRRTDFVEKN